MFIVNMFKVDMFRAAPVWHQILDHPLVQYIPLNKDPIISKNEASHPVIGTQYNIRAFNLPEDLRPTLNKFELDTEILRIIDWKKEVPSLSTNIVVKEMLYRTNKVEVLAEERRKYLELFTVNRKYFYRDTIFFSVYDQKGRRLPTPTAIFPIDKP